MTTAIPLGNETVKTDLFTEYFINPILDKTGYNPVNTIVYGILLVFGAYFLFKFLKKLGYTINARFFISSIPFILLVSVWRSLTDAGVYPYNFLTTTPGLYVPVLLLFFPLIILSKYLENKKLIKKYEYVYSVISLGVLVSQIIILCFKLGVSEQATALFKVFYFAAISIVPFIILSKYFKPLKNKFNLWMISAHMLDASSTFVSLTYYNYFEQHVAPSFIMNAFGNWAFYLWKLIVLGLVIYLLDYVIKSKKEDAELVTFIKIIFIMFGIATGTRDMLRLAMSV